MLRTYQSEAVDAAMGWVRKCTDPCLIEAATGSGKSHIVAELARLIHTMSGKNVLCTAPSAELVVQNRAKYLLTGNPASMFSASGGGKCLKHPVVFGTPGTIANSMLKFGDKFAAVIVDECHKITPTLKKIIAHMKDKNPLLRVIGLSASPYRLGDGYVYGHHYKHGPMDEAVDPFFHTCVYEIGARYLIDEGFLTPPVFEVSADHYDTSGIRSNSMGQFVSSDVERAFEGRGRKTAGIVADVVTNSKGRKGVMIFAATVQHAHEIMESLPPNNSRMVVGTTKTSERRGIVEGFKCQDFKYLVSVGTLTTGFDAPHVDVVAILRATESVALLQQIVGRGLRLADGKEDVLILDYAENFERHCPDGDIFNPEIKARYTSKGEGMDVPCPLCSHVNQFGARRNDEGYEIDSEGYFTDLAGNRIEIAEGQYYPAHYGRICQGEALVAGRHIKCSHKWSFKECHECGHENDVAARYCSGCKIEIIDPNEKLKEMAAKIANDPYRTRFAAVTGWMFREHISKSGQAMVAVEYHIDESPHKLVDYIAPEHSQKFMRDKSLQWCNNFIGQDLGQDFMGRRVINSKHILEAYGRAKMPRQVCFKKKAGSKFFEIKGVDL